MQILPFHFSRSPVVAGAFCLALATVVAGCASKNPLMEEPTPIASKKKSAPPKQAEPKQAEAAPVQTPVQAPVAAAVEKPAEPVVTAAPATPEPVAPAKAEAKVAAPAPVAAAAETATTEAKEVQPATTAAAPAKAEAEVAPAPAPVAAETAATETKDAKATAAATESTAAAPVAPAASVTTDKPTTGVQTVKEKRFLGFFRPYRPDVQQGNFVSREMVAQLKPGMTQDQVIFLLGTPLLSDIFHAERWDYAFRLQKGNGEITTSRVTVYFKDNLVTSFEGGGDLPTEADYLARIANKAKEKK